MVWLTLADAAATAALTPLTTDPGGWLEQRIGPAPGIEAHARLGDAMVYVSLAMLVFAGLIGRYAFGNDGAHRRLRP